MSETNNQATNEPSNHRSLLERSEPSEEAIFGTSISDLLQADLGARATRRPGGKGHGLGAGLMEMRLRAKNWQFLRMTKAQTASCWMLAEEKALSPEKEDSDHVR